MLVMKKTNYWMIKICITNINKTKLKAGLKTTDILKDIWLTSYIKPVIFVSANSEFVYSRINHMLENNNKAKVKVLFVYKNSTFFFIYDIKTTNSGKFPNPDVCDMSIFWLKTKVAVELQIYSRNFKIRGQERNLRYFFKLIRLYKL